MGNCKMLCQTSTNGRRPSLAPLKCLHEFNKIKKKKKSKSGAEPLRAQKTHNESSALVLAVERHFADCVPRVPEQEDSPLCCRSLGPLNSLFQRFFTGDRSREVLLLPGLPHCD